MGCPFLVVMGFGCAGGRNKEILVTVLPYAYRAQLHGVKDAVAFGEPADFFPDAASVDGVEDVETFVGLPVGQNTVFPRPGVYADIPRLYTGHNLPPLKQKILLLGKNFYASR